jgi:hypothetical protein
MCSLGGCLLFRKAYYRISFTRDSSLMRVLRAVQIRLGHRSHQGFEQQLLGMHRFGTSHSRQVTKQSSPSRYCRMMPASHQLHPNKTTQSASTVGAELLLLLPLVHYMCLFKKLLILLADGIFWPNLRPCRFDLSICVTWSGKKKRLKNIKNKES